jgi:hypothetical protein
MGCLSLELTPLDRNVLTFRHPSYFAVARVVEGRHAFAVACHEGDLLTIQSMLQSGESRLTDRLRKG